MTTYIAVCGDSFSVGHGLDPHVQFEHSFGGVVASHYGLKHLVYGRSGCCNFVIYLQVKKIIDQTRFNPFYKPLVLISSTWTERVTFPLNFTRFFSRPDLSQVDYLSYEPYSKTSPVPRKLAFRINKKHRLVSELVSDLTYLRQKVNPEDESAVDLYAAHLFDPKIKEVIDHSLLTTAHIMLLKHNIPHLFITPERIHTIHADNNLNQDWIEILDRYPDSRGTGHCDEQGHRIMADKVIKHLAKLNSHNT